MPILNGYTTLATLKARLGIADTSDDAALEGVIEAVSRWIDAYTGRRFYAAVETRYYTPEWENYLRIDDLLSVTSLKTDEDGDRVYETTWVATDYYLEPDNAPLKGSPYTMIRASGSKLFPSVRRGIEIVGSFGYSATTPKLIEEACIVQSARLFRRKDAPFGVTGAPEVGQLTVIPRIDPDVKTLLDTGGYWRASVAVL